MIDKRQRHDQAYNQLFDDDLPLTSVAKSVILCYSFLSVQPLEVNVMSQDNRSEHQYVVEESYPHDSWDYYAISMVLRQITQQVVIIFFVSDDWQSHCWYWEIQSDELCYSHLVEKRWRLFYIFKAIFLNDELSSTLLQGTLLLISLRRIEWVGYFFRIALLLLVTYLLFLVEFPTTISFDDYLSPRDDIDSSSLLHEGDCLL